MNKTVVISGSLLALSVLIIGGLSFATAHDGGFSKGFGFRGDPEKRLEMKAEFLGISTDELQAKLDEGQNFKEIAEEQGITKEDFRRIKKGKHLEKKAQLLGITVEDLQNLRDEGKTFDEILEAAGLTQEEFEAKVKSEHVAKIEERVQSGDLTQSEADEIIERIEDHEGGHGFGKGFHKGYHRFGGYKNAN